MERRTEGRTEVETDSASSPEGEEEGASEGGSTAWLLPRQRVVLISSFPDRFLTRPMAPAVSSRRCVQQVVDRERRVTSCSNGTTPSQLNFITWSWVHHEVFRSELWQPAAASRTRSPRERTSVSRGTSGAAAVRQRWR